jgi:predicted MFS family arabinose efflux permease
MATSPSVAKPLALGLLAGAQFLVFLSINIPIVAVPAVANDLEIAPVNAQFVVTAYALAWGRCCCSAAAALTSLGAAGCSSSGSGSSSRERRPPPSPCRAER